MTRLKPRARAIAFYLPQFHPIPENDEWWGKGFTEWTNVTKAKPLFKWHHQPNLPADLGFYDLRVPEVREAQAELASSHGIEGFCYWHYWFGNEKRLLERPFNDVLASGKPDFPFCLAWANQTWSGVWHGESDRILIEQTYPGIEDYTQHFYSVLPAFADARYVRIEGKPLFLVYWPYGMPDTHQFTDCWRELAEKEGLGGIHLMAISNANWQPREHGFDSATLHPPIRRKEKSAGLLKRFSDKPTIVEYEDFIARYTFENCETDHYFPTVVPNWDNTPRSGSNGVVLSGSTPGLFRRHLENALSAIENRPPEKRMVFIKSWNEWAEGNYLEPDQQYGSAYLDVVRSVLVR